MCDLYYYYFKDGDIPSGMSKTEYIKSLPKFKAANMNTEREAFKAKTKINVNVNDSNFLKIHDYLLPFYGDPKDYMANKTSVVNQGYSTDGKFYRISYFAEGENDKTMFITYTNSSETLKEVYSDDAKDIAYQVWQLFTNDSGSTLLYNVGAKQFLQCKSAHVYVPQFSISETDFDIFRFVICDKDNKPTSSLQNVHITKKDGNKTYCIKGNNHTSLLSDGNNIKDRATIRWTFEEYNPSASIAKVEDVILDIWPTTFPTPSDVFDPGYNIGIMLRKGRDTTIDSGKLSNSRNGCLYSYGELNKEINSFGSFNTAVTDYSMQLNSPRIALYQANNKSYLTFEDGSDTNFGDIIIESKSGVEKIEEDDVNVENMSYMMCFEDSPLADYDLNDVVLKFQRVDDKNVEVTVLACGAHDELYLRGLTGDIINENTEIHHLLGAELDQFVNTEAGKFTKTVSETFSIDGNLPIWQFMKKVSLYDKTTDTEIKLSEQGESPYAIIVPGNIAYPLERVSIVTAYPEFKAWVNNATENRDWYKNYEEKNVYIKK
jgi:hypothetical protein